MRTALFLTLFASPAAGWEFSAWPICTLTGPQTTVTFDASIPEYKLTLSNPAGWDNAEIFAIRYDGAQPLRISTDRHVIEGQTLTVTDSGFGNVLNGMEFNDSFTASLGTQSVTIDLIDIAPAITDFRACPALITS